MRLTEFLKKHRRLFKSAALLCAALFVFAVFWKLRVAEASTKGSSEYFNADISQTIYFDDGEIKQRIVTEKPLYAIGFFTMFEDVAEGDMVMDVYGSDGALLAQVTGGAAGTRPNEWAAFVLPHVLQQADGVYDIVINEYLQQGAEGYGLGASENVPEGWHLEQNGKQQEGSLAIMAKTFQIGGFLKKFYWAFALLGSAAIPAVYLMCTAKKRMPVHRIFAISAVYIGLLYCMILPPYAAPDEQFHINQSFNISSRVLGAGGEVIEWDENIKRADDTDHIIQNAKTTVFTYKQIADNAFVKNHDNTPTVYQGEQVGGTNLLYLPQAAAITLGRLLRLGFVQVLYLGRLANMLCAVWLVTLAVKYTPVGKGVFMVIALFPACMHQLASFSRDALTIGLYFFFAAYCLKLLLSEDNITGKDLIILGITAFAAAPAKMAYMPLLFLALLLPKQRFAVKGKTVKEQWVWAMRALLVLVAITPFTIQVGGHIIETFKYAAQSGAAIGGQSFLPQLTMLSASEMPPPNPDKIVYNAPYILSHLKDTVRLVLNTLFYNSSLYWQTTVGGILGYMDIPISWFFVIAFTLLLAGAAVPHNGQKRLGGRHSAVALLLCFVVYGLVILACISWTPTYYERIYGIQGRYFLPMLPLLFVAVQSRVKLFTKARPAEGSVLFCAVALNVFVLLNAFLVILAR